MAPPDEPLLPVESERPSRLKWVVGALAAVALVAAGGAALLLRPAPPTVPADPVPLRAGSVDRTRGASRPAGAAAPDAEDRKAGALFERAEAFERSDPEQYEQRMARWREVITTYPTSSWARKADERYRGAATSLEKILEGEFEHMRGGAQALCAAGHFEDAMEMIRSYLAEQKREMLRRRAEVELEVTANASRSAFNEAMARAKELAAKREFAQAASLFKSLASGAIPEVAERCQAAARQLEAARSDSDRALMAASNEEARRAFREGIAPRILGLVRARRYEDALQELGAAAAGASDPLLKAELSAERAAVADASSFWEAFLKAARSRTGLESSLLCTDGRRVTGKILRVQPDRIVLEGAEGAGELSLDQVHADLLVGWTMGRTLPAEDTVSYVKAALFFFCEGRDDLARSYLSTAREMGGSVDAAEGVFRRGFLRAAAALKK